MHATPNELTLLQLEGFVLSSCIEQTCHSYRKARASFAKSAEHQSNRGFTGKEDSWTCNKTWRISAV
jgi:hypothetical protein